MSPARTARNRKRRIGWHLRKSILVLLSHSLVQQSAHQPAQQKAPTPAPQSLAATRKGTMGIGGAWAHLWVVLQQVSFSWAAKFTNVEVLGL